MTHNEIKWGLGGGQVWPGVVYILGKWEPSAPGGLAVVYEDVEVLFKPLIHALRTGHLFGGDKWSLYSV